MFFYPNDFYGNVLDYPLYDLKPDGTLDTKPVMHIINSTNPAMRNPIIAWLTKTFHTAAFFYSRYKKNSDNAISSFDLVLHPLLAKYYPGMKYSFYVTLALFDEFNKITRKNNAQFMVVYIPTKYQFDVPSALELLSPSEKEDIEEAHIIPNQPNLFFSIALKNMHIPYIDLWEEPEFALQYKEIYFKKNIHINGAGNKIIAHLVYTKLVKEGIISPEDIVGKGTTVIKDRVDTFRQQRDI